LCYLRPNPHQKCQKTNWVDAGAADRPQETFNTMRKKFKLKSFKSSVIEYTCDSMMLNIGPKDNDVRLVFFNTSNVQLNFSILKYERFGLRFFSVS
jgi:hypothetical protein